MARKLLRMKKTRVKPIRPVVIERKAKTKKQKPPPVKKPKPQPKKPDPPKKKISKIPKSPFRDRPNLKTATELLSTLSSKHPKLFPADGQNPLPWAIGIRREVKTRYGVSKAVARLALKIWRRQHDKKYKAALAAGGSRYGLDLEVTGEVTEEDRAHASGVERVS